MIMKAMLVRCCKRTVKQTGCLVFIFMECIFVVAMLQLGNMYITNTITGLSANYDSTRYFEKRSREIMESTFNASCPILTKWRKNTLMLCEKHIKIFGKVILHAHNMVLDTNFTSAKAVPGEGLSSVINQKEYDEFYVFKPGAFKINCSGTLPHYLAVFGKGHRDQLPHIQRWYESIQFNTAEISSLGLVQDINDIVYATVRYEYANVYWVIVDLYDVFLNCIFNKHLPNKITVLLIDAHPKSALDEVWKYLFKKVIRPTDLPPIVRFKDITWTVSRSFSPLNNNLSPKIPFFGHFRRFFLTQFAIQDDRKPLNCTTLRVTFIWRHDYVAHPRNPRGIISRKITNEDQLLNTTRETFPGWKVRGYQLDILPVVDQVRILSETDVLVGMHGAALAFSFLVSPGGGVIELFPKDHGPNDHMQRIVQSSDLMYKKWINDKRKYEDEKRKSTWIPPEVMTSLLKEMAGNICKKANMSSMVEVNMQIKR